MTSPFHGARWIRPQGDAAAKNLYFRVRRVFFLDDVPDDTFFHIAAESYYVAYLNGIEIGRGPARGTHAINYYDSYSASALLRKGGNVLAVLCHCANVETFTAAPAGPAVLGALDGLVMTDETWEALYAEDWRGDVNMFTVQTGFSEWRDMAAEPSGWLSAKALPGWTQAEPVEPGNAIVKKALRPRVIPPLRHTAHLPADVPVKAAVPPLLTTDDVAIAKLMASEPHAPLPAVTDAELIRLTLPGTKEVKIRPLPDKSGVALVLNFERPIIGFLEITLISAAGTILDIGYEEELLNGRLEVVREIPGREEYHLVDRYVLRKGRQTVGTVLAERGFRMVQIVLRNFSQPVVLHTIQAVDRRYPFVEKGSFQCSDTLLNKIWDVCRETLAACTTDIFTDCPWRERAFWVNDLLVENLTALQLFGDPRVSARAFEMAFSETNEAGFLPGVCPQPLQTPNPDFLCLVPTSLFTTITLRDYLLYSGDEETVRSHLPKIRRILETFEEFEDENGLITSPSGYWCFFDWSYEFNGHSLNEKKSCALNSLYIIARKTYLELVRLTGGSEDEAAHRDKISRTAASIEETFFDEASARFFDLAEDDSLSSQLTHALALLSGEVSPHRLADAVRGLNDPRRLMPDFYLHTFIFNAQKSYGDLADGLRRIRKYWGDVVMTGSPTIWESGIHSPGKAAIGGVGSLCHGFATSPVDFLQTVILGVVPLTPGFRNFSVRPTAFDLEFAEGRVPTPFGSIEMKWRRNGQAIDVTLKVPQNCEAVADAGRSFPAGIHEFAMSLEDETPCWEEDPPEAAAALFS